MAVPDSMHGNFSRLLLSKGHDMRKNRNTPRKNNTPVAHRNARLATLGILLMTSLSGCHTVNGAGKDTSAIGKGISNGATSTQTYINKHI